MTAIIPIFPGKNPADVSDFTYDFVNFLAIGENILTAVVTTTPDDITVGMPIINNTQVTAWLGGGTLGTSYFVTYVISTDQGRNETRDVILNCQLV
jgi:hypothetical protein